MKIENHRLIDSDVKLLGGLTGPLITPEVIVLHYAVTHSLSATVAAQKARGYWAHLSIDGYQDETGAVHQITQALPFNMRGSHAGKSSYKGRSGVNGFSIGVEIANPGPLIEKNGELFTVYGKKWPRDQAMKARHSGVSPSNWNHWAIYTDQEIDIIIDLCHSLKKAYPTIVDVVGHDEISPGRKFDPGPAMPMEWIRKQVFG